MWYVAILAKLLLFNTYDMLINFIDHAGLNIEVTSVLKVNPVNL